jgi:hypothetical protein
MELIKKIDFNFLPIQIKYSKTTMSASNNNTSKMSLKTPQSNNINNKGLEVISHTIYNNPTTMQFTQSQANPLEYCIGNDTYVVFETQPKFKIITRNPAKDNYELMLKQLMNGKQKVLKKYVSLFTSDPKPMRKLPFYQSFREDWVKTQKENNGDDWTPTAQEERVFASNITTKIHNMVMREECSLGAIKFKVHTEEKWTKKKNQEGDSIRLCDYHWTYELGVRKTMDLGATLQEWSVDITELDSCASAEITKIWNQILNTECRLMPTDYIAGGGYKWCDKKNALGQTHNSPYGSYNGDCRIKYIEILYARGGLSKSGKPMPNRIYRKNSDEMVDNPYSVLGQTENLRWCAESNNIKRYSKMNKTQLVKALMNL